jgi:hypothetical protein
MVKTLNAQFIDSLPAIFRQDEVDGVNFLTQFLQGFEHLFDTVQQEIDAVPDLFAIAATPVLVTSAKPGEDSLQVDSAAGLCVGDVLQILAAGNPNQTEFVVVQAVSPEFAPTQITLEQKLRFAYPVRSQLRPVGTPLLTVRLRLPVGSGATSITLTEDDIITAEVGDILRIDEGSAIEYAQVIGVVSSVLTLNPALQHRHEAGQPVIFLKPLSRTTPPAVFANAERTGADFVLRTPARAGETVLELDTLSGLDPGAILHLRDPNSQKVEFVQVQALPSLVVSPPTPATQRFAIRLQRSLRFDHLAGIDVALLSAPIGATRLKDPVNPVIVADRLTVKDLDTLGALSGSVLQVGADPAAEFVQVIGLTDNTLTIAPALQQSYAADQPVTRWRPAGSGTNFMGWLASWIGLSLRANRGERWNQELLRLAGRIWNRRGSQVAIESFLQAYLRGEAKSSIVFAAANPLQIGLVSTIGVDTVICGNPPYFFWVDLETDERNTHLYSPEGLNDLIQAAQQVLQQGKPAHTYYDLRIQAHPMQLGVDPILEIGARVGDTTLLWDQPLIIPDDPLRPISEG